MNNLIHYLILALSHLPRPAVARVARQLLASLATVVEGATTNTIVKDAESVGFGQLDALLAKIEAEPATP